MANCRWCDKYFESVYSGGREKKYCDQACKTAFHAAIRKYTIAMMEQGFISVEDIRRISEL